MGPVERELRRCGGRWWTLESEAAMNVFWDAAWQLGFIYVGKVGAYLGDDRQDVSSEAIEAAAALGL